jgi:hypothetical protein
MSKEIDFHNKKMGLLEAQVYLFGLNTYMVSSKLTEEEQKDYLHLKEIEQERNNLARELLGKKSAKKVIKNLDEREYLIDILKRKIDTEKNFLRKEYCEKYGHKKGIPYSPPNSGGALTHSICSRCGALYEKKNTLIDR